MRLALGIVSLTLASTACATASNDDDAASADPAPEGTAVDAVGPSSVPDTGSGTATQPAPTQSAPASGNTSAPDPVTPEALQFSAPLVGGGEFSGADMAGKPTIFWFWAPT